MSNNLRIDLEIGLDKARAALKQLQQEANQIAKSSGSSSGGGRGGGTGGGGGLTGLGGGNLGTSAAIAGLGALSAAVGAVSSKLNELTNIANKLSESAGSSTSSLGQLRSSLEQLNIGKNIAADNPGVIDFAKLKAEADKTLTDFTAGLTGSKEQRDKQVAERLSQGLGGPSGEEWRRMKEAGNDLLQDQNIQRTALQTKWQRTERDFDLSQRKFKVDTANQLYDLQKESNRQNFDQQIAVQRYQENFENQQSAKAFALNQKFAQQNYQIQVGRTVQDYSLNKSYQTQDFSINKARSTEEFNINRGRQGQDYSESLTKAVLGGANGMDLMWMSKDFRKEQSRAAEDFQRSQRNTTQDFKITQGREATALGLNLSRGAQDFGQSQAQTLAGRQLEIESQDYARKYEGIELQTQLNRQTQDLNTAFQRLNQSIGFQKEQFKNQASDLTYDKNLDFSNFNLQTSRQRRDYGYSLADFAGQQRLQNPVGAVGQATFDPAFARALQANASQTGQEDLISQFNKARQAQEGSLALKLGEQVRKAVEDANQWLKNFGGTWASQQVGNVRDPRQFGDINQNLDMNNPKFHPSSPDMSNQFDRSYQDELNGKPLGAGQPQIVIQTGGNSFNLDPGLTVSIQKYIDEQDKKNQQEITNMIRSYYGG